MNKGGMVYPRVCGGTVSGIGGRGQRAGLSPRVRGNPWYGRRHKMVSTVYPRVCGGTINTRSTTGLLAGLSPRVRGNQGVVVVHIESRGSIPACAGEPGAIWEIASIFAGLSPRVRGNLSKLCDAARVLGSIPACAGEPSRFMFVLRVSRVYPRVCGGTQRSYDRTRTASGLSPRVRGNQERRGTVCAGVGSIPACAGEPQACRNCGAETPVYPRMCGGTIPKTVEALAVLGLSPRVRGNLVHADGIEI